VQCDKPLDASKDKVPSTTKMYIFDPSDDTAVYLFTYGQCAKPTSVCLFFEK